MTLHEFLIIGNLHNELFRVHLMKNNINNI